MILKSYLNRLTIRKIYYIFSVYYMEKESCIVRLNKRRDGQAKE